MASRAVHISNIDAALNAPDELHGYRTAALLLRRMLGAGISKWHPNPLAALAGVEARQAAK